jgi:hypothetical protein
MYGFELVLDVRNCNTGKFTEDALGGYFDRLCAGIGMHPCVRHFWVDEGIPDDSRLHPHIEGISAVQFISTSSIVVHALTQLAEVYVNIFSCKDFDHRKAREITLEFFGGDLMKRGNHRFVRGLNSSRD